MDVLEIFNVKKSKLQESMFSTRWLLSLKIKCERDLVNLRNTNSSSNRMDFQSSYTFEHNTLYFYSTNN